MIANVHPMLGGSYDGANCMYGRAPDGTTASIVNQKFMYAPVASCPAVSKWSDKNTPTPWLDESNSKCFVSAAPASGAYVYNNWWYIPACTTCGVGNECKKYGGVHYGNGACEMGTPQTGITATIENSGLYFDPLLSCPHDTNITPDPNAGGKCFFDNAPANPFIWANSWYYQPTCPTW